MSNSSLVSYTWQGSTANSNPRDHVIDTITIHHMAANGSLEACFKTLAYKQNPGSVNYGIDSNGKIGLMIPENLRAWTSDSRPNDMRAVTIEVANDQPSNAGGWHVSDKAYAALINLCADICKRNDKTKMIWCGNLNATNARSFASNEMRMTLHKWFVATGCPGPYLESKMQYIADEVTKHLNPAHKTLTYRTIKDTPIVSIKGVEPKGKTVKIGGRKTVCGVQYGRIDGTKDDWISLKDCKEVI